MSVTNVGALIDKYVVDFISKIQQAGKMRWYTAQKDTDFGTLLHKEGLFSLYKFKEDKSLVYHLCREVQGRFELRNTPCDPETGMCIYCQAQAPEEIHGLWKLHNFDWIQENGAHHV